MLNLYIKLSFFTVIKKFIYYYFYYYSFLYEIPKLFVYTVDVLLYQKYKKKLWKNTKKKEINKRE